MNREYLLIFCKGLLMGTADVIPGISGGTIALVVGIYHRLVHAVHAVTSSKLSRLLHTLISRKAPNRKEKILIDLQAIDFFFLLSLGCGIATAIIIMSKIIPTLMQLYPMQMNALFFGLVYSAAKVPFRQIKRRRVIHFSLIVVTAIAIFSLVGITVLDTRHDMLFLFFSGAVAICGIILPGVSGSYILKVLGQYEYILDQLHQALTLHTDAMLIVGVFIAGIVVGITLFVRILLYALNHFHDVTMACLTGIMYGALRAVWPFRDPVSGTITMPNTLGSTEFSCLLLFSVGVAIATTLVVASNKHKS